MRLSIIFYSFLCCYTLSAQPNCEAFKHYGDELKYKACKEVEKCKGYYQFSKEYQQALDDALAIDSTFAYAYQAKSVAYLKSGDFFTWKRLMDKAVLYAPKDCLGYRGWCRYQFFRDYEGAIKDIERLDELTKYDIGHSVDGNYHLHIARALCYKSIGQRDKAISIIEEQLLDKQHLIGSYDYLHLGVLYFETKQYDKAIEAFQKQQEENDLAENNYYLSLIYKAKGEMEAQKSLLEKAKQQYQKGIKMFEPYAAQTDKIYLEDIERELQLLR